MVYKLLGVLAGLGAIAATSVAIGLGVLQYNKAAFADYWQGRANQPGDFILVVIGDSAAQSLGASKPENGYISLLAGYIEQATGRSVRTLNFSVSGATVSDALHVQAPQLRNLEADLVLVEIGANDMDNYNAANFSRDYDLLLQTLPPEKSIVANLPYFGYRPDQNHNAEVANWTIAQLAARYRLPVADLYSGLHHHQSPLIYASDFFHPNNRGHRIWYESLQPSVEKLLPQPGSLAE